MGKEIALVLGKWVLQVPSMEVGSPLEAEIPLELEPPLEISEKDILGETKRGQGGLEMGLGQGL